MSKNRPIAPPAEDAQERSGLLLLAIAGLAVGALAGLAGSAFHWTLDHAAALRDSIIATAHTAP